MDEKKKQLLERDAKIRSLQSELEQLSIKIRGHSEDTDGKFNRLEKLVKELTDENTQLKAQVEGNQKQMDQKVKEAKEPLNE